MSRTRFARAAVGAAVALSLAALPMGANAAAEERPTATLRAVPATAEAGEVVRFVGRLTPRLVRPVLLQRRDAKTWRTVKRSRSSAQGRFRIRLRQSVNGKFSYRVLAPATRSSGRKLGVVRTRRVVVTVGPSLTQLKPAAGLQDFASFSSDGRYLVRGTRRPLLPADTDVESDLYLQDVTSGALDLITTDRMPVSASISQDGSRVLWMATQPDSQFGRDMFLWERSTDSSTLLSSFPLSAYSAVLSGNGTAAAVVAPADVPVEGSASPTRTSPQLHHWSEASGLTQVTSDPVGIDDVRGISADGGRVSFISRSKRLVPGKTVATQDVFVWDRRSGAVRAVTLGDDSSDAPRMSTDGRWVAFTSNASNLVPGDTNNLKDVFLADLDTGRIQAVTHGNVSAMSVASVASDGTSVTYSTWATDPLPGTTFTKRPKAVVWTRASGTNDVLALPKLSTPAVSATADGRTVLVAAYEEGSSSQTLWLWRP